MTDLSALTPEAVALAEQIVAAVVAQTGKLLAENAALKAVFDERAGRLAQLSLLYRDEADEGRRRLILDSMDMVRGTVRDLTAALLVAAETAARDLFWTVADAVFSTVIRVLPALVV